MGREIFLSTFAFKHIGLKRKNHRLGSHRFGPRKSMFNPAHIGRIALEKFLYGLEFAGFKIVVEAQELLGHQHSGFSVDACVCIEAADREGLERCLRCCAA